MTQTNKTLTIANLHATVEEAGKAILNGLSLAIPQGQVHAVMGPNGAGKSTLGYTLAGREGYTVTKGDILLNGQSLLELGAD